MLPDVKLRVEFPGFGSLEVEGECCGVKNVQEISIKFTPCNSEMDTNGWMIRICRNGNCDVQEMKPQEDEEEIGVGVS